MINGMFTLYFNLGLLLVCHGRMKIIYGGCRLSRCKGLLDCRGLEVTEYDSKMYILWDRKGFIQIRHYTRCTYQC